MSSHGPVLESAGQTSSGEPYTLRIIDDAGQLATADTLAHPPGELHEPVVQWESGSRLATVLWPAVACQVNPTLILTEPESGITIELDEGPTNEDPSASPPVVCGAQGVGFGAQLELRQSPRAVFLSH